MSYIWQPTNYDFADLFSIKKGDTGTKVAALQLNIGATVDGVFGTDTDSLVKAWQSNHALAPVDGIAGFLTQRSVVLARSEPARVQFDLPVGLLGALAEHESDYALAAYSQHPSDWGYDLGAFQNSIGPMGDQPTQANFEFSYNVSAIAVRSAQTIKVQQAQFKVWPFVDTKTPGWYATTVQPKDVYRPWIYAYQLAIFNHNWPSGAENLAKVGSIYKDASRDDQPAQWIITATGGRLSTPRQWFVDYVTKSSAGIQW